MNLGFSGHLLSSSCLSLALIWMLSFSNAACGSEGSGGGAGGTTGSGGAAGTGGASGGGGASGAGGSSCTPCGEGCGDVDCECADGVMVSAGACYDVLPQNQCCHYDKTVICAPACATHGGWSG